MVDVFRLMLLSLLFSSLLLPGFFAAFISRLAFLVASLTSVLHAYELELGTKHLLLTAIVEMIQSTPTQADLPIQDTLLQLANNTTPATSQPSKRPSLDTLELYLATWVMEPNLSSELITQTSFLLDSHLSTK